MTLRSRDVSHFCDCPPNTVPHIVSWQQQKQRRSGRRPAMSSDPGHPGSSSSVQVDHQLAGTVIMHVVKMRGRCEVIRIADDHRSQAVVIAGVVPHGASHVALGCVSLCFAIVVWKLLRIRYPGFPEQPSSEASAFK